MEQIYTIPVNEVMDELRGSGQCTCPVCRLYRKLEENELDLILGASMMEPDIRSETNRLGFCGHHFDRMIAAQKRLPLALILESHLAEVAEGLGGGNLLSRTLDKKGTAMRRMERLHGSCYICSRIAHNLRGMIGTIVYLFETDAAFAKKLSEQPMFCIPHLKALLACGKEELKPKVYNEFYRTLMQVEEGYLAELRGDVSHFCKKFDYRYEDEPWGNSKDSIERSVMFLCGEER